MSKQPSLNSSHLLICSLAFVVIVPQIGLGMITPLLPSIANHFETSVSNAQGTMVAYMIGYAISVLLSGYFSDLYGPRQVQIYGLSIGTIAAAAASLSPDVNVFYICRFLQALGACVSTVTTRLIVSSSLPPEDRMPALTTLTSALAITPCIAPLAGASLMPTLGWRGIMLSIAGVSSAALIFFLLSTRKLTQTHQKTERTESIFKIYEKAIINRAFLFHASAISLVWMSYFSFVSCSAEPLQMDLGLSPVHYGLVLSIASIGYVLGSQTARKLSRRKSTAELIRYACTIGFFSAAMLTLYNLKSDSSLATMAVLFFPLIFATGMSIPASQAGMLESTARDKGVISGLFFFLQMIAGAFYAGLGNFLSPMSPDSLVIFSSIPFMILPAALHFTKPRET